ncbi:MAG: 4Fe-4S double cluster binding domain-containing protein [Candidatus Hodarchaeota archaeon]
MISRQGGIEFSISDAKRLANETKEVALKAGADLVGIVSAEIYDEFPRIWVGWTIQKYTIKASEIMSDAKSIVVMGFHVWDDMLELAVRKEEKQIIQRQLTQSWKWIYPGYFPLKVLSLEIKNHIEKIGFKAVHFNDASGKRLAQLAGLGSFGKNTLIINPIYGPWIRFATILTNAEMAEDNPFDRDLCGDCKACIEECPVGALTPYKLDDAKCLVGIHITGRNEEISKYGEKLKVHEPNITKNAHLMCMKCQKACKYGRKRH